LSKWSRIEHFLMQLAEYPFMYSSNYTTAVSAMDVEYSYKRFKKKVIYIPNGVDVDIPINRETALLELKRLGIPPHNFLLFAAGRIIERKGAHILLQAFKILGLDMPLAIIGDLAQVPDYEMRLKDLAGDMRVFFIPALEDGSMLFGILDLCKLFVFPSTAEGMSVMFLEAASLGIPMVCSDIPENTAVLGDNVLYFRSGDPADLADKIRWAIENPQEMTRLGQSSRNWVRKNFSWEGVASKYDALYQQCLQGIPLSDVDVDKPFIVSG
jgi:glycosyltransferase involved in cell wall biosynthesis